MHIGRHDYTVFAYCHQGRGQFQLDQPYALEPGSLMLMPGWVAHQVRWQPDTQLSYLQCRESELPASLRGALTSVRLGASPMRKVPERAWKGDVEALLPHFLDEKAAAPLWVHQALGLIFEHCQRPWSLTRLADHVGVSAAHLTTQVRLWTGRSLGQWSLRARLDYAGLALADGTRSVAQVAEASGFSDLCHFRRLFRRQFQHSPQEHRTYERI